LLSVGRKKISRLPVKVTGPIFQPTPDGTEAGGARQAPGNYYAGIDIFDWNQLTMKWMKFVW
ncbi:hypothetical protein QP888_10820, partial [Corynebacterium sp. MSK297]|nr:hypothetical protein [Corynebacterium sp. MSK297]